MQEVLGPDTFTACLELDAGQGLLCMPGCHPAAWSVCSFRSVHELGEQVENARSGMPVLWAGCSEMLERESPDACWQERWRLRLDRAADAPGPDWFASDVPLDFVTPSVPFSAVTHAAVAALSGLLGLSRVAARTERQGVVVLYAGLRRTTGFLVFRQHVYGVYEHTASHSVEDVLRDMHEFKLTWLPDEVVRASGGFGSLIRHPVPDEAESFEPVYLLGPNACRFEGYGLMAAPLIPSGMPWGADAGLRCYGLARLCGGFSGERL